MLITNNLMLNNQMPILNRSTVRPFLLVTLSHSERRNFSESDVIERFKKIYSCRSIIVSREPHKSEGYHYHVGIEAEDVSKNTFIKVIRAAFPEFEGRQIDIRARKGFGPICSYVTKYDKSPSIFGDYDKNEILRKASASDKRRGGCIRKTPLLVQKKKFYMGWALLLKLKWILLFHLVSNLFSLEIPSLFLFLWEKISLLYINLSEIWEGPEAETTPDLPKSDSSWEALSIILIVGCAAFVIITSIFWPKE